MLTYKYIDKQIFLKYIIYLRRERINLSVFTPGTAAISARHYNPCYEDVRFFIDNGTDSENYDNINNKIECLFQSYYSPYAPVLLINAPVLLNRSDIIEQKFINMV